MGYSNITDAVTLAFHDTIKPSSCQGKLSCVSMLYMEIALVAKDSLRIKGKQASLFVDPSEKVVYTAALLIRLPIESVQLYDDAVIMNGPGEYEVGGIKISGMRSEGAMVYSLRIDGVSVLVGRIQTLEKLQQKLGEHQIVVAYEDSVGNASFITSLATNVVIFYGDKAREIATSLGKENVTEASKYVTTVDKLPAEVETVILS